METTTAFQRGPLAHLMPAVLALIIAGGILTTDLPFRPVPRSLAPISLSGMQALRRSGNAAYPRLANYNGYDLAAEAPAFAQDGLIIAGQDAMQGDPSAIALLRRQNPRASILVYQRTLQVDYPLIKSLYGTDAIYPGWWLLRAGSVLTGAIDATQTEVQVADPGRFQPFDDVLVGAETMHVLAIRGSTLEVQRGFFSQAGAHPAGARIAAHYSYRMDLPNTNIQGSAENRRPWSFNLASTCPRDAQGRTWDDFLAGWMAHMMQSGQWDGVFFDNTDEFVRDGLVDANNDNQPDGGVLNGRNVWHDGEVDLLRRFHKLAPGALIMYNGTLDAGNLANGREMEGFPLLGGGYMPAMDDYSYWSRRAAAPALMLVNPDTARSPRFDLGAMRFGLTSALLGDGFYTYDEGWHRHGAVWNFDEYDNGAGSVLLGDLGIDDTSFAVAHPGRFHVGDLVLVGREQMRVVRAGNGSLLVERGQQGTVATTHPAGSVIATTGQIAAGTGYLGRPLGAAYPLLPPLQSPNLVVNGDFSEGEYRWFLRNLGVHLSVAGITALEQGSPRREPGGTASPSLLCPAGPGADAQGYAVAVPWQSLRRADVVALTQGGVPVQPGGSYTLSFWARGVPGEALPLLLTGERPSRFVRYAPFTVTLHGTWSRYVLRYTAPPDVQQMIVSFLFGHTYGRSMVAGVCLQEGQALVYGRAFEHGLVLVNQGDTPQNLALPRTYWHLRGDQDPALNDGRPVHALLLPPHTGLILLNHPPP